MTAPNFTLIRDSYGRLVLTAQNDEVHVGVVPVRAFPIAAPADGIVQALIDQARRGIDVRVIVDQAQYDGTGGTSAYVLPVLPADRVERYTYTDVSPHFLGRARQKFVQYPFADYRVLDIEGDLAAQGFDGQQFDIVVAATEREGIVCGVVERQSAAVVGDRKEASRELNFDLIGLEGTGLVKAGRSISRAAPSAVYGVVD